MPYTCCHTLVWAVASLVRLMKISTSHLSIMTNRRSLLLHFGGEKVTKSKTLTQNLVTLTPTMTQNLVTLILTMTQNLDTLTLKELL